MFTTYAADAYGELALGLNAAKVFFMNTLTTTSIKMEPALKARVQRLARARDRSSHWVLQQAVERFVDEEEKRESFRADALAAWADYQATGEHISGAEADAWLGKLKTGSKVEDPPACR